MSNPINREAWLEAAVQNIRPLFLGHGYTLPEIRISVGWPSSRGLSGKKRVIRECWAGHVAADGKPQIFISPLLDEVVTAGGVLATVVHEVCHVAAGHEAKHGPKFVKVMKKLGLEGKPTSTLAGDDLLIRFQSMLEALGPFPHSKLVPVKEIKKQTTRMRKCECDTCGYLVRLTQKWADVGVPSCPLPGHGALKLEIPLDDGEGEGE